MKVSRFLLTGSLFWALVVAPSFAEDFRIFAPSRTTNSLLVVDAKVEGESLSLSLAKKVDVGISLATIVAHPEKPYLYTTVGSAKDGGPFGLTVELDEDGNYLKHTPFHLFNGYSYLSLDRANRFLLGASYGGGQVDVYALDDANVPSERVAYLDEGRRNAHCVLPSPDNKFVYIPYVKDSNALLQYDFDPETGSLKALDPPNANPPEGTGPRHMAYHPKLPIVYFSNEQHLGVSVYEKKQRGQLILRQVCDAVDQNEPKEGVSSSDIAITSDGRFLFAGIRGHQRDFDWISRYKILENGEVEFLGLTPVDKIPWGLALSPDGRFLMVTAFKGATLTAFQVGEDGSLTKAASLPIDENISDIVTR